METLTQIAIWNRALGFLGARSIAAEDENTPEALQCRLYWDSARRQALRDYPWAFAQRRAWLARVALPSGFEQEYRFAYALPEACLKAHEVRHEGLLPLPFCLARDPAGDATILLTSASRALLLYTEDVRHCHQFDDLFAHMLARKLACLLAARRMAATGMMKADGGGASPVSRSALKDGPPAGTENGQQTDGTDALAARLLVEKTKVAGQLTLAVALSNSILRRDDV